MAAVLSGGFILSYIKAENMKKNYFLAIICFLLIFSSDLLAQQFSRADSLRGTLNKFRSVFDVTYYELDLRIIPEQRFIQGSNTIHYNVVNDFTKIQLDLFANMQIDSILFGGQSLEFNREGDAFYVDFPSIQKKGEIGILTVYYNGNPTVAERPPWDGGFVWQEDSLSRPWIGVACEGIGASLWWPNKDHLSDEPDSMLISLRVPEGLMAVSNGNLREKTELDNNYTQFAWFVSYPINNYNVTVNIAEYAHIHDTYKSGTGKVLDLDYYVLSYNEDKARKHFKQVNEMLACFEQSYGPYPFWEDGYALVETPYWGMEHQGAIAYGNEYQNNEFGFDFIIVHESAHEYWGNSISVNDHAEMWIHEAFTTYAEALYLECRDDYETAVAYLMSQKPNIKNKLPVLGPMGVNYSGWEDADMYYKGSWMLHSMRNTIDDPALWHETIKDLYQEFALSHPTSSDVIAFMSKATGYNLNPIFELFLTTTVVPQLEYRIKKEKGKRYLEYRWNTPVEGFNMGMKYQVGDQSQEIIYPTNEWQNVPLEGKVKAIEFDHESFYFEAKEVK